MTDEYKYDSAGISSSLSNLKSIMDEYNDKLDSLNNLKDQITSSTNWEDIEAKTAFLDTVCAYIAGFSNNVEAMSGFIDYVSEKNDNADAIEKAFSV